MYVPVLASRHYMPIPASMSKMAHWPSYTTFSLSSLFFEQSGHFTRPWQNDKTSTKLQRLNVSTDSSTTQQSYRKLAQGWRGGAISCFIATFAVFLVSLVITITIAARSNSGTLFEGDCDRARKINSGLHVVINVLSTILLSSSNYCMQCLSAPTRHEIDSAHARGTWLDIGILSIRNLRSIKKKRVMLWAALGLSSLPLHLCHNAAVFASISAHDYEVYAVGQSFVDSPTCPNCTLTTGADHPYRFMTDAGVQEIHRKARQGRLDRLENSECIDAYAVMHQSKRGDLLLVTKDVDMPVQKALKFSETSPAFWHYHSTANYASTGYSPTKTYTWICSGLRRQPDLLCTEIIDQVKASPADWTVRESCNRDLSLYDDACSEMIYMQGPIQYCLSEKIEEQCKVYWSRGIAVMVMVLNLVKALIISYTALLMKDEPLMTMGDVVVSYMCKQDPYTTNMCLTSSRDVRAAPKSFLPGPRRWRLRKYAWRHALSRSRCAFTLTALSVSVVTVSSLLGYAFYKMDRRQSRSLHDLARIGFGAIDTRTIIHDHGRHSSLNSVISNTPQVIVSLVYFSYNSMLTCMLLEREWASYAYARKGLRVSTKPRGEQRSTYFLSLPYRFAIPLMAISGLIHWLVSQSLFFVALEFYNVGETEPQNVFHTCGYSPIAMIVVIILGSLMLIVGVSVGFIPYRPGATLVGSCSAVISSACHLSPTETAEGHEVALSKVQWGVVNERSDGVGHCAFSKLAVERPVVGQLYA